MNVERMQENVNRCMKQDRRRKINNIDAYACIRRNKLSILLLIPFYVYELYLNIFQFKHLFPFDSIILCIQMASKQLFAGFPFACGWVSSQRKFSIYRLNICKFPCCLRFQQIEFKFSSMRNISFYIFLQQSMLLQKTVMYYIAISFLS